MVDVKLRRSSEPANPSPESLAAIEAAARHVAPDGEALRDWCEKYIGNHSRRLAFDLDLLRRFTEPGDRVLEIGSTPPVLTGAAVAAGYQVTGIDLAPERFAGTISELGLDVRRSDIEKEPVPADDGSFDVVLLNEVFEHLRINPIYTVGELRRVLKPGGLLLLSTPNLRSANGLVNLLFHDQGHSCQRGVYEQYSKVASLGHMGHVREYTVTEVVEFLRATGFAPEEVVYRGRCVPRLNRLAGRVFSSLRPFFSCIARKDTGSDR